MPCFLCHHFHHFKKLKKKKQTNRKTQNHLCQLLLLLLKVGNSLARYLPSGRRNFPCLGSEGIEFDHPTMHPPPETTQWSEDFRNKPWHKKIPKPNQGVRITYLGRQFVSDGDTCTLEVQAATVFYRLVVTSFTSFNGKGYNHHPKLKHHFGRSDGVDTVDSLLVLQASGSEAPVGIRFVGILVGGWTNPSEKYDRQIGNFRQIGVKIKNSLKPPPSIYSLWPSALRGCLVHPKGRWVFSPLISEASTVYGWSVLRVGGIGRPTQDT